MHFIEKVVGHFVLPIPYLCYPTKQRGNESFYDSYVGREHNEQVASKRRKLGEETRQDQIYCLYQRRYLQSNKIGEPAKECHARFFNRTDIHSRDPRLQHHLLHLAPEIIPALTMTAT